MIQHECKGRLTAVLAAMGFILIARSFASGQETLESLEKRLTEQRSKIRSVQYDVEKTARFGKDANSGTSTSKGKGEMLRKGDKCFMRVEMETTLVQKYENKETTTKSRTTTIGDGEFAYTITETDGKKEGVKRKAESWDDSMGGAKFFEKLRRESEPRLLPDETVDGRPAYVIEAPSRPREGLVISSEPAKIYIGHDEGLVIQTVVKGRNDSSLQVTKLSNMKINVDLDPDRFVFKAPEGVEFKEIASPP